MKRALNPLTSSAGFGLIPVLFATAIMMIVVIGISRGLIDSLNRYRQFAQAQDGERMTALIREALSSDKNCSATFGVRKGVSRALPTAANHFEIDSILGSDGKVIANKTVMPGGLQITKFEVMPLNDNDALASVDDGVSFIGQIRISYEKVLAASANAKATVNRQLTQRSIPVSFEKDASGKSFQSCVSGKSIEGNEVVWILHSLQECLPGQGLVGIDAGGAPICEQVPPPPPTPTPSAEI